MSINLKKIRLVFLWFLLSAFGCLAQESAKLDLTVNSPCASGCKSDDLRFSVVLKNIGGKPLRLLDIFDDPNKYRAFFRLVFRDETDTPVGVVGGGKISMVRDDFKYRVLKPNEKFEFSLEFRTFSARMWRKLEKGSYRVFIDYYNYYGTDCFIGTISAKPVRIKLTE